MEFYPRESRYLSGDIIGDIVDLPQYKYDYGTSTFEYPLPNCPTYAYGRIMEQYIQQGIDISDRTASYNPYWWNSTGTHFGNAAEWYDSPYMTWERGSTPKLGAIACFDDTAVYGGHVAIVEAVDDLGRVSLSESSYGGAIFHFRTDVLLTVGSIDSYCGGRFQGFIYIPLEYGPSKDKYLMYRRGKQVKIINYGRASSYGNYPVARGIGWVRDILRIYKDRPYPVQVGDIRTGETTGFYQYDSLRIL